LENCFFDPYKIMTDPNLCGPWFDDPSFDNWKVFVKVNYALELTPAELEIYRKYTDRRFPPTELVRDRCGVIGRRGGKTEIGALLGIHAACFVDYSFWLAPGEYATVMHLAGDRAQARNLMQYTVGFLENVPLLESMIEKKYTESILLNNRVRIEIHTNDYRSVRGYTLAAVICDEISFWRDERSANADVDTIRALRPGLLTIPCSWLLVLSSPYAQSGYLWKQYQKHFGKENSSTLIWQASTLEMNPKADREQIQSEYEEDPISAAAEYGAQFRRDVERFVNEEAVIAAIEKGRFELPWIDATHYAFVDTSGGGGQDRFAWAVCRVENGKPVLVHVDERTPPFNPAQVVAECCEVLRRYKCSTATGDRYGGGFVHAEFIKGGIQYETTAKSKSELFTDLLHLLNSGRCELLDNEVLVAQLLSLERRTGRGRDQIEAPPNSHDDLANACAGVLSLPAAGSELFFVDPTKPLAPAAEEIYQQEQEQAPEERRERADRARDGSDFFGQSLSIKKTDC